MTLELIKEYSVVRDEYCYSLEVVVENHRTLYMLVTESTTGESLSLAFLGLVRGLNEDQ